MRKFFIGRNGPAPGSDRRAMNETAGSRPAARASSPAAEFLAKRSRPLCQEDSRTGFAGASEFDHAAWWLDAATGGEYLDDRIRVREPGDETSR